MEYGEAFHSPSSGPDSGRSVVRRAVRHRGIGGLEVPTLEGLEDLVVRPIIGQTRGNPTGLFYGVRRPDVPVALAPAEELGRAGQ